MRSIPLIIGFLAHVAIGRAGSIEVPTDRAGEWKTGGVRTGPKTAVVAYPEETDNQAPALIFQFQLEPEPGKSLCYAEYFLRGRRVVVDALPESLTLALKGSGQDHPLAIRFLDNLGRMHQWIVAKDTNWDGWKKVTVSLQQVAPGYRSWVAGQSRDGGEQAVLEPPLVFYSFCIDRRPGDDEQAGEIGIGEIQIHAE